MAEYASHTAKVISELDPSAVPADADFTIEQQVTDGETVIEQFHVCLIDGQASVIDGPAKDADVTIRQDQATAEGLRSGEIHAQRAFLTGRLFIDGDIEKLLAHGELLTTLVRGRDA